MSITDILNSFNHNIPIDILKLILEYKSQIDMSKIYDKNLVFINNMKIFHISLCKNCRIIKIINFSNSINIATNTFFFNEFSNENNCEHNFFLIKPIHIVNRKMLFKNLFQFYCSQCSIYDIFYEHLHYD